MVCGQLTSLSAVLVIDWLQHAVEQVCVCVCVCVCLEPHKAEHNSPHMQSYSHMWADFGRTTCRNWHFVWFGAPPHSFWLEHHVTNTNPRSVTICHREVNMCVTLWSDPVTEVSTETSDREAERLRERHHSPCYKTLHHRNDHFKVKKWHNVALICKIFKTDGHQHI